MWYQPDIKSAHLPVAGIILHVRFDNMHIIKSTYCVISNEFYTITIQRSTKIITIQMKKHREKHREKQMYVCLRLR